MQQLTQQEMRQVSGSDGYNLIVVSLNVPSPSLSPEIANLVAQLMNGQMNVGTFAQALNDAGGMLVQYLTMTPACPGPFPGNCPPPLNPMP